MIPDDSFWKTIEQIGAASFSFMIPILAGYIAYSIADKPGLVPGMIGGYIAATGSFYGSGSGGRVPRRHYRGLSSRICGAGHQKIKSAKSHTADHADHRHTGGFLAHCQAWRSYC